MNIYLIIAIGLIIIALPVCVIAFVMLSKQEQPVEVKKPINDYRDELEALTKKQSDLVNRTNTRIEKMRPFIASYFNTLYKESNSASEVKIINQITHILERRIEKANMALRGGVTAAHKVALDELQLPIQIKLTNELKTMSDDYPPTPEEGPKEYNVDFNELSGAMENLLQSIGQRIAAASASTSSYRNRGSSGGGAAQRKRKRTMTTLTEIGIKIPSRNTEEEE